MRQTLSLTASTLCALFVLTNSVKAEERRASRQAGIPFRDTTIVVSLRATEGSGIIEKWKAQPEVPLPTLDHHIGKITASIALFSVLALAGIEQDKAGWITSGAAVTFETMQVAFFNETPLHALNDVVLFNYHWSLHLALQRNPFQSVTLGVSLTGIYLSLLGAQ